MCDTYNCEYCREMEVKAIEESYRYTICGSCERECEDCIAIGCANCGCSSEGDNPQPKTEIIDGQEICWDCSCSIKAHSETCAWA